MSRSWLQRIALCSLLSIATWMLPASQASAAPRCERKRDRCMTRCLVKAKRFVGKCRRRTMRRRNKCLRRAYIQGKRCVRKLKCPQAKECYASCKGDPQPAKCYVKRNCAGKKVACYASCQLPQGEALKQCMAETKAGLKACPQRAKQSKASCQGSCPTCS